MNIILITTGGSRAEQLSDFWHPVVRYVTVRYITENTPARAATTWDIGAKARPLQLFIVVTVRYFAAARAAVGVPSEDLDLSDGATVGDVLDSLVARHGQALRKVLGACSFLLDSVAVRDPTTLLRAGAQLDILPPFAGG